MSKPNIKSKILDQDKGKKYTLTEFEFRYIKDMNDVLTFHTLRSQLISNFITYVCQQRLGYEKIKEGYMLTYELDPTKEDHTLTVREVPKPKDTETIDK